MRKAGLGLGVDPANVGGSSDHDRQQPEESRAEGEAHEVDEVPGCTVVRLDFRNQVGGGDVNELPRREGEEKEGFQVHRFGQCPGRQPSGGRMR